MFKLYDVEATKTTSLSVVLMLVLAVSEMRYFVLNLMQTLTFPLKGGYTYISTPLRYALEQPHKQTD